MGRNTTQYSWKDTFTCHWKFHTRTRHMLYPPKPNSYIQKVWSHQNRKQSIPLQEFKWYVKHELRVTSYKLRVESLKARVESLKPRVEIQKCEFKSMSYEFESTRIIKSMKTQVNRLKSSSFPKIISPKLLGNSWGNLYVQFLVIISCFTFPLLHGYGRVSKH